MTNPTPQTEEQALDTVRAAFAATDLRLLRFLPGRHAVVQGALGDTLAIFRVALSDKAAIQLAEQWGELQRIGPHMADGPYRVNRGLGHVPGVLAVAKAAGQPLLPQMQAGGDPAHLTRMADWLAAYAAPTLERRKGAPDFWLKQATRASARQPHPDLRAKEQQILQMMQDLAAGLRATPWQVAITHGDFHPNNLFWDGTTLTGIDTGGSAFLPVYKDMARSLVHLARRNVFAAAARQFGVDAAGIAAYTRAFALTQAEVTHALRFFLGFECLIKTERPDMPDWRLAAAHRLYDGLLTG